VTFGIKYHGKEASACYSFIYILCIYIGEVVSLNEARDAYPHLGLPGFQALLALGETEGAALHFFQCPLYIQDETKRLTMSDIRADNLHKKVIGISSPYRQLLLRPASLVLRVLEPTL
jgi:hypothetical protein